MNTYPEILKKSGSKAFMKKKLLKISLIKFNYCNYV